MNMKSRLLLCLSTLLSLQAWGQPLENGQGVEFSVPGQSVAGDLYIEVPLGATKLKVELISAQAGTDFDLFVRHGSPFTAGNFSALQNQASYLSGGANANEEVNLTHASHDPLRKGRWYIGVLNFNATTANIELRATYQFTPPGQPQIEFIFDQDVIVGTDPNDPDNACNIDGWFDATAFTPVGGNSATTLGEARRNAVLKAVELMTENIQSEVPLIIQGCWPTDLETSANSAVLANAAPRTFIFNSPGLTDNTWYPIPVVERINGSPACKLIGGNCNAPVITVNFNPLIDTDAGLGTRRWYYGTEVTAGGLNPDFVSTAMHEMTHGLGFLSTLWVSDNTTLSCPQGAVSHTQGSLFCGRSDAYTNQLVLRNGDDSLTPLKDMGSDAQREGALTSVTHLLWDSVNVMESVFNTLGPQSLGLARLYAPDELNPGSSVSHLSSDYTTLMEPFQEANLRELGLADPMLWDIGWDPRAKPGLGVVPTAWFDPAHNGHGMVIEPIPNSDLYFVVFYTYNDAGEPEWFTSLARVENGVLNVEFEDETLLRFLYDYNVNPAMAQASQIDPSITEGRLRIDFNHRNASRSTTCNDGVRRDGNLALVDWKINDQGGQWCITPTFNPNQLPDPDFGGTWWTGDADSGWGFSLAFAGDLIIAIIYFYDEDGNPRWVIGSKTGFVPGQSITVALNQMAGYGRTDTPQDPVPTPVGSATFLLNNKSGDLQQDGTISIEIKYNGEESNPWVRENVPLTILTEPH